MRYPKQEHYYKKESTEPRQLDLQTQRLTCQISCIVPYARKKQTSERSTLSPHRKYNTVDLINVHSLPTVKSKISQNT